MEKVYQLLEDGVQKLNGVLYGPVMVGIILLIGLIFSIKTGFFQLTQCRLWLKKTIFSAEKKKNGDKGNGISQFQALATALAGTMGTGNIVGVATALVMGGPGAIFWMWISAFVGMMTKYAETVLAVLYRRKNKKGQWLGGAMEYIEHGLGKKWMASLFAVFCIFASFGMGNMTQANSIADAMASAFQIPPLVTGGAVVLLTALVIFGGITRIAKVSEKIIPALSVIYILGGLLVIAFHFKNLPETFLRIFSSAFGIQAAAGGIGGYAITVAMRYGVGRGIFSNEAGLGSSGMVYAAAENGNAVEQGMWGIFEVFADTMVVCSITALAILSSGAMDGGTSGAQLCVITFESVFGKVGTYFIAISIAIFAFASMIGWAYYGERGLEYLVGERLSVAYKFLFLFFVYLGCVSRLEFVWNLSESFNGLMAIPNLIAVVALAPQVLDATASYRYDLKYRRIGLNRNGSLKVPEVQKRK